ANLHLMDSFRFLAALAIAGAVASAQDLPLMPWPAKVAQTGGELTIEPGFKLGLSGSGASDPRVKKAAQRALYRLFRDTGGPFSQEIGEGDSKATPTIVVERKRTGVQKLGDDESYHLTITPQDSRIVATEPLGALRGLETFLQLVRIGASGFAVPSVEI